jgi:hypothetical protein
MPVVYRSATTHGSHRPSQIDHGSSRSPSGRGAKTTRTGIRFDPLLPIEDWKALGEKIALYADATAWWLGDWLAFGQMKYGRRYKEGIDVTGLEYQTLRNYAVVARRFDLSRRRDNLSFQHHAEVCALPDDDQDFWLDLAAERRWSKSELRRRLRGAGGSHAGSRAITLHLVLEPQRDERWRRAAEQSDCALEDWVTSTLDAAAGEVLGESP